MDFTFYADLVGISSLYRSDGGEAYNALNDFYNEVFFGLEAFHSCDRLNREVQMLSDSILVSGENIQAFVEAMAPVYANLLKKGLLLRGGAVRGRIRWDTRIEAPNFKKRLPESDVLARAASLEKQVKGARFLLDPDLARHLLLNAPSWLSDQGYLRDRREGEANLLLQRSIKPLPNGASYEVLYPLLAHWEVDEFARELEILRDLELGKEEAIAAQYRATETLLRISKQRLHHHNNRATVRDEPPYEAWLDRLLEARVLPIRQLRNQADANGARLDWKANAPRHGGVYAFWWDGAGQGALQEMATRRHLHFKSPGGEEIDLDVSDLISRRLENGLTPLYVGKSFRDIAGRIGLHLCLGSQRVVPQDRCGTASPRKTTTCQLRDRLDRLFPHIADTRPLLDRIRVSWVELCGQEYFAHRFFLEDLAIGKFQPAFNVDSER